MNYQETLDYLYNSTPLFQQVGKDAYKEGLGNTLLLDEHFGHPHRRFKTLHVAGTNGKGSCSHTLAAILQSAGYKVGLYTSPHLVDFRERMRINGEMIPESKVIDFVERWQKGGYTGDKPSFFELTMMMALDWFAAENVDYAVIEVGMGGRLDSTNILEPLLSVVTNISWDHTQFLGDTLPKIAAEKAGIIKSGIPAVIGEAEGEVAEVFRRRAREVGTTLRQAFAEVDEAANEALQCPLAGSYQKKNVNTARVAVDELRRAGVEISDEAVAAGFRNVIANTHLRGRWTIVEKSPLTICDTGHNEAGLRYNMGQLASLMAERPGGRLRMVIGFVADKDVDHILPMFPKDAIYYVSNAQIPRAMKAEALLEKCEALGLYARALPTVAKAYAAARAEAGAGDIIYIGGSTFVVADFLAAGGGQ